MLLSIVIVNTYKDNPFLFLIIVIIISNFIFRFFENIKVAMSKFNKLSKTGFYKNSNFYVNK